MMKVVMIAAILAILTAPQQTPAERLSQFLSSAKDRSVDYRVEIEGYTAQVVLSYQDPNLQYLRFDGVGAKGEFYQTNDRVMLALHSEKSYYEFKGYSGYVGIPPESGLPGSAYPGFLHAWSQKDGLKDAVPAQAPPGANKSLDWIKKRVESQGAVADFFVGVSKEGEPRDVLMISAGNPPVQIKFEKFGWPEKDMREWKYQPPVGYTLGNASNLYRPYQAGNRVDWGKWVDSNGKSMNMDQLNSVGVAVVFTSTAAPDQSIVPALQDLKKSLAKLKVNMVEVHLDEKPAPKRDWPVTLDANGLITKQFDPPYTPYIFFVRKDRYVIGAWAGYGADQKAHLIKTATEMYNPSDQE